MRQRGFTMIEAMITITILGLLLLLAMPAFIEFAANAKVRNVTESLLNGLRQAQLEAVKRNTNVKFRMTADGWEVRDPDDESDKGKLHSEIVFEKSSANPPKVSTEPVGSTEVTFSGLGRVLEKNPPSPPGTDPIAKIKVDPADKVGTRSLGVAISALGGNVKMCDADAKFTYSGSVDPLACPYPW